MASCSRGTPPFWHTHYAFSPPTDLARGILTRKDSRMSGVTASSFSNSNYPVTESEEESNYRRSRRNTKNDEATMQKLWNDCQERHKRPADTLHKMADIADTNIHGQEFAIFLDNHDPLRPLRSQFVYPKMKELPYVDSHIVENEDDSIYLCGHSLGLKPRLADQYVKEQLQNWGKWGVHMHMNGKWPAALCDYPAKGGVARLLGAQHGEVVLLNTLTVNLHLLLMTFYRPSAKRFKILVEENTFPSDMYALRSQIEFHGLNPEESLVLISPRPGEHLIRNSDILKHLQDEGDDIALVFLNVIDFRTGQMLDVEAITSAAKSRGSIVGWGLAHAIANVPLQLHKWGVDFACFCSYKYLNSGAGGVGGIFVHDRLHSNPEWKPRLHGWWSNRDDSRFEMRKEVELASGPDGFRVSNPSPWHNALLMASLKVLEQTNMEELRAKQRLLTGYLELLVESHFPAGKIDIITPRDPDQRGSQMTLTFIGKVDKLHMELQRRGVVCDVRPPAIIRVAMAPLYNSFDDAYRFVIALEDAVRSME